MVLYQSTPFPNPVKTKSFHVMVKLLNAMELLWTDNQKDLQKAKILKKMVKAKTTAKYTQKLLKTCKSWGGPLTNREMLKQILKNSGDHQDKIVRTKLLYYWDTHKSEIMNTQDLFKLNKISHEDWLINLCVTQRNAIRG